MSILKKEYEREKREYGKSLNNSFVENNKLYLNPDFDLDSLYEYGFGWCDKYCHDENGNLCGAYEIFIDDSEGFGSLRIYYIPALTKLSIEEMSGNSYYLIYLFLDSLKEIGMLSSENGIKINLRIR